MTHTKLSNHNKFDFGGLGFYSGNVGGVVSLVDNWIFHYKKKYLCVTGVHGLAVAQHDLFVRAAHQKADLIVPDGVPLVWIGRACGHNDTQRIYGPDLFLSLCKLAEHRRYRVFLYGTTEVSLKRLSGRLLVLFPRLVIVGSFAPPFRALTRKEEHKIAQRINKRKPQLIFVGLSTPKQELWMHTFRNRLKASTFVGVGAAFDFVSGAKPQAPTWMRTHGVEWLYRLLREPKRLWWRYVQSGTIFLFLIFRTAARAIIGTRL